ncbi:MAG: hypothetical protein M0D57_09035 [Sphingobacteriales bacterium JAD_PAG50586_3]|nr:MAG: hypothetical protein M0D57_09035 [Sphingobacteriales bacterium JAD_PAG50586_3]
MKALLITAMASFFALSASAQVATDTKATTVGGVSTGQKVTANRPNKVAESTTPATPFKNAGGDNAASKSIDANAPILEKQAPTKDKAVDRDVINSTNTQTPALQSITTNKSSNAPAIKSEAPKQ